MPRGNPEIYKYSQYSGINVTTNPEENENYIDLVQESFSVSKPDLHDPEQVDKAIQAYFDRCKRHNIRPGNMGLYNALGVTRQEVNAYINGRMKAPNSSFIDVLKKIKASMGEYREILGNEGKISPPTLIFWQKNHDGFEDVQRVEVDANTAPKAELSPDEIRKKLEQDLPIDADYTEV